jgi:leucyl aminopeptidase
VAAWAKRLAKEEGLAIEIFDRAKMRKMGMDALLAVADGSVNAPMLVRLDYNKGKKLPLYCIVGKGVTFDSGGISIKPSAGMHEMKYDKSGAMNVLGVMRAVSRLRLPIRVIGLMPLVENMPSGSAQRPGDIVRAYNGKTIEVLNTDAEGRLILADALAYAAEQKPESIIDMATLTGAIVVSLGRHAIGLFSNDDPLSKAIIDAGEETSERVWRLPIWPEYGEMIKADFADIKNITEQGEASSITAAMFLKEFVGDAKWAHLDIAAVDYVKWPHPYLEKGASGMGVRLVTETLARLPKKKG